MVTGCVICCLTATGHLGAQVAKVLVSSAARYATTARRNETKHHVVSGFQPRNILANALNDTAALMATDHWRGKRQVTSDDVFIAVAHTRGVQLHKHLGRAWLIEFNLLDTPW
jgi:hypothetical protein